MKVEIFETYSQHLDRNMTFRVILPDFYEENMGKNYPVLYMQDGQDMLYDNEAYDGVSWDYASYYRKYSRYLPEIIIVAIDCPETNTERTRLYAPYHKQFDIQGRNFEPDIDGQGKAYISWIVHELKPWIDHKYRTRPEKEFTAIGGSSTGGVTTIYALMAFSDIFTRAFTLSAAFYIWFDCLNETIEESVFDNVKYIYMDVGGHDEGRMTQPEEFIQGNKMMYQKFLDLGFDDEQVEFRIFLRDYHDHRSFGRRFPDALRWIFKDI